jgi:hypothetical protein
LVDALRLPNVAIKPPLRDAACAEDISGEAEEGEGESGAVGEASTLPNTKHMASAHADALRRDNMD